MEHTSKPRLLCTPRDTLPPDVSETTLKKPEVFIDTLPGAGPAPPKGMYRGHPPVKRGARERIR
jgi:hypothetical protein